ncbi:hypothetical protein DFH28DRAFT_951328 [Melampsora americana]|nr:hypothetical protein DFH28DRAFT_951328 [Melampsora americana]
MVFFFFEGGFLYLFTFFFLFLFPLRVDGLDFYFDIYIKKKFSGVFFWFFEIYLLYLNISIYM